MKPLNQKERNDLFIKFSLLFTLSVSILVAAIFFDFKMPEELSLAQKKKLMTYENILAEQKPILTGIDTIQAKINSLNLPTTSISYIENKVNEQIVKIEDVLEQDSVLQNNLFKIMIINYKTILEDKKNIKILNEKLAGLNSKLEDMKEEVKKAREDLTRTQLNTQAH